MQIQVDEMLSVNGVNQFVAIRAEEEGLPLLLYLHGGPGDAALPLVLNYNSELAKHFTLVVWEQRGAGKSYYKFVDQDTITIDTFVQDTHALVQSLLARFDQSQVYLLGHSWGSVLGLLFCQQYPKLVHSYIGCGQVVNLQKSCQLAYDFAARHATGKAAKRLSQIDASYTEEHWLKDLLFVTKQVVKHRGSLYGASNYNRLVFDILLSKHYRFKDIYLRQKGSLQSIQCLWQELMGISFEHITSYAMPVVFIEGETDAHVSWKLAKDYYDRLTSPKSFYLFEKSAHFPQWCETDRFHQVLISLTK